MLPMIHPGKKLFLASLLAMTGLAFSQEILRYEVCIYMDGISIAHMDDSLPPGTAMPVPASGPLDLKEAKKQALDEAALFYGGMIYGWKFSYEIGEKKRKLPEEFVWEPLGSVSAADPRLISTDFRMEDARYFLWTDYRCSPEQDKMLGRWRAGAVRTAQAVGYSFFNNKLDAMRDAARAAIRSMLRAVEKNRPKHVSGYVSLAEFPHFYMDKGQWAARGRFLVEILEITPFAAY